MDQRIENRGSLEVGKSAKSVFSEAIDTAAQFDLTLSKEAPYDPTLIEELFDTSELVSKLMETLLRLDSNLRTALKELIKKRPNEQNSIENVVHTTPEYIAEPQKTSDQIGSSEIHTEQRDVEEQNEELAAQRDNANVSSNDCHQEIPSVIEIISEESLQGVEASSRSNGVENSSKPKEGLIEEGSLMAIEEESKKDATASAFESFESIMRGLRDSDIIEVQDKKVSNPEPEGESMLRKRRKLLVSDDENDEDSDLRQSEVRKYIVIEEEQLLPRAIVGPQVSSELQLNGIHPQNAIEINSESGKVLNFPNQGKTTKMLLKKLQERQAQKQTKGPMSLGSFKFFHDLPSITALTPFPHSASNQNSHENTRNGVQKPVITIDESHLHTPITGRSKDVSPLRELPTQGSGLQQAAPKEQNPNDRKLSKSKGPKTPKEDKMSQETINSIFKAFAEKKPRTPTQKECHTPQNVKTTKEAMKKWNEVATNYLFMEEGN
eukprot:TRINITY_DN3311_c0_g1_i4.p1 TRINITY_DN3311_c0_g1~~TRINITY_DN3311_c0_g1_i4.p1  ORF type:complete len:493 (+),score=87.60 TRINITY_DN3311_c0_g1_i4:202-1680(+)